MLNRILILKLELMNDSSDIEEIKTFGNWLYDIASLTKNKKNVTIFRENNHVYWIKMKLNKNCVGVSLRKLLDKVYKNITDIDMLLTDEIVCKVREFFEKNNFNFNITKIFVDITSGSIVFLRFCCFKDKNDVFQIVQDATYKEPITSKLQLQNFHFADPYEKIFGIEDITKELVWKYKLFLNLQTDENKLFQRMLRIFRSTPFMLQESLTENFRTLDISILSEEMTYEMIKKNMEKKND
ncbi:hypothetical protein [Fusobacterium necrophorum]|uniref:hypothetical protein n=1 Tax=Fusobacterium necrophorum TaxID=859 RepID=UPI00370E631F